MACISLGKIDKNIIPIIVGSIFCFLNRLLNEAKPEIYENTILTNIVISLSRFLTIIPLIIFKIKFKQDRSYNDKNNNSDKNSKSIVLIYKNNRIYVKGVAKYVLLSAVIYLIQSIFFALAFKATTNAWIWYILIASIFYYLMFKVRLYKHHYLSIFFIIVIGTVIDLTTEAIIVDANNEPLALVSKYIKEILFSLYNVIAKYVMEKKYISVYEFSFYIGAFNLIVLIIFSIFDNYFFHIYSNYGDILSNLGGIEILKVLGVLFTQVGINLGTLFTTKNCSPCHLFIIFVFGQVAYYINFDIYRGLVISCLIIILFFSLIFSEIIEINLFGLSYNTKRNIIGRSESEILAKNETIEEMDENPIELKNDINITENINNFENINNNLEININKKNN
jgi:hypothetical protein